MQRKSKKAPPQPWELGGISGIAPPGGLNDSVNVVSTGEKLEQSLKRGRLFHRRGQTK
jgi:hypothetical protein